MKIRSRAGLVLAFVLPALASCSGCSLIGLAPGSVSKLTARPLSDEAFYAVCSGGTVAEPTLTTAARTASTTPCC